MTLRRRVSGPAEFGTMDLAPLATRPRALALAVAALCTLPGLPAAAAEKPKVVLLPYQALNKGVGPELSDQAGGVIAQELGALGIEVVRKDDVAESAAPTKGGSGAREAPRSAPTGDAGAGDRAQELIQQARAALEDSNVGPAIDQLKKAIKLLQDNGDAVPDLRILSEAYLQLGVAHFRDGDEDQANDALSQAVHFMPQRELEETDYPPIFIRVFNRVRFDVLRRPRTTIEVRAAPGAAVLLDGRNLGKSPLNLTDVLPGPHWVRVERAGQPPEAKKLLVRAKNTILVEFTGGTAGEEKPDEAPVGVLGAVSRNALDKTHLEQLRQTGKREGAAFVLVGAIYRTDTAYNIYTSLVHVSDGAVGRAVDVAFDLDMLSAQIEVFKLAEDIKKQVLAGKPNTPIADVPFALAPKIDVRQKPKKVDQGREVRVSNVAAAPAPIAAPKDPQPEASARPAVGAVAGAGLGPKPPTPVKPASTVVPKDEQPSIVAAPPVLSGASEVVPRDEKKGEGGSNWWIWALVGVAVAGGAAAGGIALAGQSGGDQGSLRITW